MYRKDLTPTDHIARAVRMRRYLEFKSEHGGLTPFLKKEGLIASGKSAGPVVLPRAPPVSKTGLQRIPISDYSDKAFTFEPQHMHYYGRMEGYQFTSAVPKFDPWVRDILREDNPSLEESLTDRFLRDPSTPDRIMKHFKRYDRKWNPVRNTPRVQQAKRITAELFSALDHSIEPIDLNIHGWGKIVTRLEMASSPGLPLRREFKTQAECLPFIYDKAKRLNHFAKFLPPHKVRAPPCMIGLRPGMTEFETLEEKVKARGVWSYPAEVKVVEQRYVAPILDKFSTIFGKTPYVVGANMTKALPMVIDHLLEKDHDVFVSDISHLDDSVGPDLIRWAFSVIENWFEFGFTKSSYTRDKNVFEFIKYYFINTLILLPSGQLVRKRGGVPSGSGFTQLVDTLVSVFLAVYGLLEQNVDEVIIRKYLFAVGDDIAATVPKGFSKDKFKFSLNDLGYEINAEKAYLTSDGSELIFLGYGKYGGNVRRSLQDLLKQALFPERYVGSSGRSSSRLLGQYLACSGCDPRFNRLVHRAFDKRLFRPLDDSEIAESQMRWFRKVSGESELPNYLNAFEMFPLF